MQPAVLIVGAGLSGLAAARPLQAAGWRVTVLDKGRGPGGRLATRRLDGASFDTGAQFFSVREPEFAALVAAWERDGVIAPWSTGFASDDPLHGVPSLTPAEDGHARYLVPGGMNRLAKHLAAGLDVRCGLTATRLDVDGHGVAVTASVADGVVAPLRADAVILTAPVPQALALVDAGTQPRPLAPGLRASLAAVRYAPCLCLLLAYPGAAGAALPRPGGVRLLSGPIQWLASQRAKGLCAAGEGLVVHAAPAWNEAHYALPDDELAAALLAETRPLLARLCGPGWDQPAAMQLKKWQYSLATATVPEAVLVADLGAPVLFAGDAFGARPRVEGAALSGLAAARALLRGRD